MCPLNGCRVACCADKDTPCCGDGVEVPSDPACAFAWALGLVWVLVLLTETAETRSVDPRAGALSSEPLVVLLLSSDGGVTPEAMLTRDLALFVVEHKGGECKRE